MDGAEDGVTCVEWFFCTKDVSEADVYTAIGPRERQMTVTPMDTAAVDVLASACP